MPERLANMLLLNMDESFADHDTRSADPRRGDRAVRLFGTRPQCARPPHLDALRQAINEFSVCLLIEVSQQTNHGTGGAASSRIFRDSTQWREHTRSNIQI